MVLHDTLPGEGWVWEWWCYIIPNQVRGESESDGANQVRGESESDGATL